VAYDHNDVHYRLVSEIPLYLNKDVSKWTGKLCNKTFDTESLTELFKLR